MERPNLVEMYNRYVDLQDLADTLWGLGEISGSEKVQEEANIAYRNYEYAGGLRDPMRDYE